MEKITLMQRGRQVEVYQWSMSVADDIIERTILTGLVMPGTDLQIYWAEAITNAYEAASLAQTV